MEYIKFSLAILMILFIFMAIIRIYMIVASYVGEKLGIGKFFIKLWEIARIK